MNNHTRMEILNRIDQILGKAYHPNSEEYKKSKVFFLETILKLLATVFFLIFTPVFFDLTESAQQYLDLIFVIAIIAYVITLWTTSIGYYRKSAGISIIVVHLLIYGLIFAVGNSLYAFYWSIFLLVPFITTWFYLGNKFAITNLVLNSVVVLVFPLLNLNISFNLTILFLLAYLIIGGSIVFSGIYFNRRQQEMEQIKLRNKELQKVEAMTRLTGGIAHDFNNLLTTVTGYCELIQLNLEQQLDNKTIQIYLQNILKTTEIASALIDQLLEYSKNKVVQRVPINIDQIITNMKPVFETTLIGKINLNLNLNAQQCLVMANVDQLKQLLLNLTFNSVDAMPNGGDIHISTMIVELDGSTTSLPPGSYFYLQFSDTGVGIPKEVQTKIFDPFFTTKTNSKSSGLGLSTVYGIVEQSGGSITVDTTLSSGTTFHIYLPLSDTNYPIRKKTIERKDVNQSEEDNLSILVVEDNPSIVELINEILKPTKYNVKTTTDGMKAWKILNEKKVQYNMIISDIKMPNMDGIELTQKVLETFPQMRILLISGYTASYDLDRLLDKSQVSFLSKPFSKDELMKSIKKLI